MLKRIIDRYLKEEGFAKNAFVLTIGTTIAQAFPLIFYPVIGRIFSPEEFGLLATLTSITSILAVSATGKYEGSILIADDKVEAANIIGLVIVLSIIFLLISYLFLQMFSPRLMIWFDEPGLRKWMFVCPISAFAIILFNCFNEWCVRNKYFLRLSWNKIINAAATTLAKLFFGIARILSSGLVIGDLIGRLISASGSVFSAVHMDWRTFAKISSGRMKLAARRFIDFPRYVLPAQLINTVGVSLPVFMIGVLFNSKEVGYFSMTMNVISVPVSVISLAIRDVFRQRANEEFIAHGNCIGIYRRLLTLLSIAGGSGFFLLFFVLPGIFEVFLGSQWRVAGEYSQILIPMIAIKFVEESLSSVFIIAEKLRITLFLEIYNVSIAFLSFWLGFVIFRDMKLCLIFFASGRITSYLLNIILAYRVAKGDQSNV
jgi:O-antigen/teichoic acid export membrane protein